MCPTTISPLMIWIEHDTQLMRDLADKVLVLHYGKELALGPAESGFVRCRGDRGLYRQALTSRDPGYHRPPVANLCSVVLGFGGRPPEES